MVNSVLDTCHCPQINSDITCEFKTSCMKVSKLFFILFSVLCLFVSCGEDDKEEIVQSICDSFLECQEGSLWKLTEYYDDEAYVSYFKLNNDLKNPLEIFSYSEGIDCYYYMDMSQVDGVFEVMENSKSKFAVRITGDEDDRTEWELTIDTEKLNIIIRNFENDEMYESFQMLLEKSNVDFSQFKICNDI